MFSAAQRQRGDTNSPISMGVYLQYQGLLHLQKVVFSFDTVTLPTITNIPGNFTVNLVLNKIFPNNTTAFRGLSRRWLKTAAMMREIYEIPASFLKSLDFNVQGLIIMGIIR